MARRNYSDIAVVTTLNGAITDSAVTLIVNSATGYPTAPFLIQIENELILVGAKSGTTFSTLTRGYGATSGAAHSDSVTVDHRISATDVDEVWTHDHQTADGHSAVSHDDLTGVSINDHHTESHTHASHTSVGNDDHHNKVHATDHALGAADSIASLVPVGTIMAYGAVSAPTGWKLCDGTSYTTAGEAALFAVIGYTFGGSGGNFSVPDLRQRFPIGVASSGTGSTIGDTGGTIDHSHTGPSHAHTMPTHIHTMPSHLHAGPSHTHNMKNHFHTNPNTNAAGDNLAGGATQSGSGVTRTGAHDHGHTHGQGITGTPNDNASNAGGTQNTGSTDPGDTNSKDPGDTNSAGTGNTNTKNPPFIALPHIIKA